MDRRLYGVLWVTFTTLLLAILYWSLHDRLNGRAISGSQSRTYKLSVSAPRPGDELPTFKATRGDTVTILIGSDRPGEAHLHGYEKEVALKSGGEVALTVTAKNSGVYPLHLHERLDPLDPNSPTLHRHLATLEVESP